jgi:hypothetical protein
MQILKGHFWSLIPVFVLMAEKESATTPSATTSRMPPGAGIDRPVSGKPISVQYRLSDHTSTKRGGAVNIYFDSGSSELELK